MLDERFDLLGKPIRFVNLLGVFGGLEQRGQSLCFDLVLSHLPQDARLGIDVNRTGPDDPGKGSPGSELDRDSQQRDI